MPKPCLWAPLLPGLAGFPTPKTLQGRRARLLSIRCVLHPRENLGLSLPPEKSTLTGAPGHNHRAFNPQVGECVKMTAILGGVPKMSHRASGKFPVSSKASRPVSAYPAFHSGALVCGGLPSLEASPPRTPVPSGTPLSGAPGLLRRTDGEGAEAVGTLSPSPPTPPLPSSPLCKGAGCTSQRVVGGSGTRPGFPGAPTLGSQPPTRRAGQRRRGRGALSRPGAGWDELRERLPLPRLCHPARGRGRGVKVRPQVRRWGAAARSAAIFGHFGAAGAPPAARAAAARQPCPRPPPALSHRPGGGRK